MGSPFLFPPTLAPLPGLGMSLHFALILFPSLAFAQDRYQTDLVDQYQNDPYQAGSFRLGPIRRVPIRSHTKCPLTTRQRRSSTSWSLTRSPTLRRKTMCQSHLPINTEVLMPRVLSLQRWKTKAKTELSEGSTGFSSQMAGHRLSHTLQMRCTAIRQRSAMRVRHIQRSLNRMTTWALRAKSECDNIRSTPDSHMDVTEMYQINPVARKY